MRDYCIYREVTHEPDIKRRLDEHQNADEHLPEEAGMTAVSESQGCFKYPKMEK